MSLVGIRPRSEEEWSAFPANHVDEALKYAPGLCGIQYAYIDNGVSLLEREEEYLFYKRKANPQLVDQIYFQQIRENILLYRLRSS